MGITEHSKVGITQFRRLLAIEQLPLAERQSNDQNLYHEGYFSIHLSSGSLCVTDHSFAGGYGGGYADYVDELIRYDIPFEEFTSYCHNTSPLLASFFKGIGKHNLEGYLQKIESLPEKRLAWQVGSIADRGEFKIVRPICMHDFACIYLCKKDDRQMLAVETIACKESPMVVQAYSVVDELDLQAATQEELTAFADQLIKRITQ
ncbi:MAG: hypothetical protein J6M12_03665 [Clostridia bacterium]|nr:hypothetical protein [Clostridia bacterium]